MFSIDDILVTFPLFSSFSLKSYVSNVDRLECWWRTVRIPISSVVNRFHFCFERRKKSKRISLCGLLGRESVSNRQFRALRLQRQCMYVFVCVSTRIVICELKRSFQPFQLSLVLEIERIQSNKDFSLETSTSPEIVSSKF